MEVTIKLKCHSSLAWLEDEKKKRRDFFCLNLKIQWGYLSGEAVTGANQDEKKKHFKMSGKEDFLLGKIGRKGDTLVGIHSTCPTKVDGRKKKDK